MGLCVAASAVTALAVLTLTGRGTSGSSGSSSSVERSAVAATGELSKTLRVGGTIETLDYAAIRAPQMRGPRDAGRSELTLVKLAEAGTVVPAGSVVAEFELKWLEDHIEDRQSVVVRSRANLRKRESEVLVLKETERQARVNAQALYDKALLDLRTAEVRSQIEAELLQNDSEAALAAWKQLEDEGHLMERVHSADLRYEELDVKEQVLHVERHERDYERLQVRTPISGMVVRETMLNRSRQFAQSKVGDQVYPGALFMRIVDTSKMVLNATVNQVDAQQIRLGSEALVEIDAYPGERLKGRVADMGAMATSAGGFGFGRGSSGSFIKHIPVRILIDEADERILPDLSASADILLSARIKGIVVPREAVRSEPSDDGSEFVHVAEDGEFRKRRVQLLDVNDTEALIGSGLDAGEQVLLSALPANLSDRQ